jgi:hypothetical protein
MSEDVPCLTLRVIGDPATAMTAGSLIANRVELLVGLVQGDAVNTLRFRDVVFSRF